METIVHLTQYILHIDEFLLSFVSSYGLWTNAVLFLIIFCETGLVVTPILPGDSLLFAAGSIAAQGDALSIQLLLLLLTLAAVLGNKVNYFIGRTIGPRIFTINSSRFFNKNHLLKAHAFYERHGGKTIILSRFLPIIRTFVPFIAGVSYMDIGRFSLYNLISAILWVGSLLMVGYFFGNLPWVKQHFSLVIYSIVAASLLPAAFTLLFRKRRQL